MLWVLTTQCPRFEEVGLVRELQDGAARIQRGLQAGGGKVRLSTLIRLGPGHIFLFSGEALTRLEAERSVSTMIRLGPGRVFF